MAFREPSPQPESVGDHENWILADNKVKSARSAGRQGIQHGHAVRHRDRRHDDRLSARGVRSVRLHPQADEGPSPLARRWSSRSSTCSRTSRRTCRRRTRSPSRCARWTGSASRSAMIGVSDETSRAALKQHPDRFVPSGSIDRPERRHRHVRQLRQEYEEFGIRAVGVFPVGHLPAGGDRRPEDVPGLPDLRGPGHPDLLLRGGPRAAAEVRAAGGLPYRRRDVRLPRPGLRHAAWLRAVGEAGREAHAQVAEPVLLDLGVRAQGTTRRRSSTTPTRGARTRSSTAGTSRWD